MRTQLTKITLAAGIALAITFTLSCSNGDDDPGGNDLFSGDDFYEYLKERVKYYDPDNKKERCENGVVEWVCELPSEDVWYNPLKQTCNEVDYTCEGGNCYETYELGTIEACGSILYNNNSKRRCQGGVYQLKCKTADGDKWYNPETYYCDWSYENGKKIETVKPMERCGSKYYESKGDPRCEKGVVEYRCGHDDNATWFNSETHNCSYNWDDDTFTVKPRERCGSVYLHNDSDERCKNGVVEYRCGSGDNINWYNHITQSCDRGGTVTNKLRCVN